MKRGKREAKRTGLGRRLLSVFLAVVMCTSMLQLTVFAEGTDAPAGSGTTTSNIMDGAFVLNKDGSVVSNEGANTVNYPTEGFTLTKSVAQPAGYAENEFEVTLEVKTSQEKVTTLPVAAIQLVIDISTSMNDCGTCDKSNCNHASRMTELKNVLTKADGFLDTLAGDDVKASKVYVSVVTYGKGAKAVTTNWEDIKTSAGLENVKTAITGKSNGWYQQGGISATDMATNIQAGLMLARNRLSMTEAVNADVNYVVLLSDGQANSYTYSYDENVDGSTFIGSTDTGSISNGITPPDGANGTNEGKRYATDMADAVKAKKATLYGVGYGTDHAYLADIIGNADNTYAGNDSVAIADAFDFIAQQTTTGINGAGAIVTDPMGDFITMGNVEIAGVSDSKTGLTWVLDSTDEDICKISTNEETGVTTYTYTITYPITLDTADPAFEQFDEAGNIKYYPTNGYTYLKKSANSEEKLAFNVPGVAGKKLVSVPVSKVWNDNDDQDGKRPDSVTINLLADGQAAGKTLTLSAANKWTDSFTKLYKYDAEGKEIAYTITENAVAGYEPEISGTAADGYVVTNTCVPEVTSVTVSKVWNDNDDQDGIRPDSITINLLANGEATGETLTLSADNEWSGTFSELAGYSSGKAIEYTISEVDVPTGYTSNIEGYVVTNTHAPEKTSVSVTKVWDDANNQDGIRPASVTITLLADGNVTDKSLTLSADNNWTGSFTELDKNKNGSAITYTVSEAKVDGYNAPAITGDAENGFVVTNTHAPEKTSVSVSKIWSDKNNQDGKRPASVTINLLADGQATGKTLTLSADNNWTGTFSELDKNKNGSAILYTVTENAVKDYNTAITGDPAKGFVVTNSYSPENISILGNKIWIDGDNVEKTRPESIVVRLHADGKEVARQTVKVNKLGTWTFAFANLDRYADGKEIKYTITEDEVPGYDTTISGATVTNTLTNASLTINKRADGDITDPDKIPGDTAFIVKDATGATVATVYYKDFKHGSCTINLPVGTYTVTEDETSAKIDGYELKVVGGPTAKVEVAIGANAYVGFTNHYEKVPHAYTVVHEYYTYINGTGDPQFVGDNGGKTDSAKFAPSAEAVYLKQAGSENYKDDSYSKGALKDVVVSGELEKGTLVYTVKYYRNDWTVGALTINKTISGLDEATKRDLMNDLYFTVEGPDCNETIAFTEFDNMGSNSYSYTLPEDLTPGTYTVKEFDAEVDGGYDLNVVAKDADEETEGYQVKVTAGAEATSFNIENNYTGRIYNVWFNGGDHGTVTFNGEAVEGVYRNRVLADSDALITWSLTNLPSPKNQNLYQIGANTIYPSIGMGPEVPEKCSYVMYTFTWADYVNYTASLEPVRYLAADEELDAPQYSYDLAIEAPGLVVDSKYKSDKVFYIDGTKIPFDSEGNGIDAAVAYMNSGAVKPDADGVYNVLYVPAYTTTGGGGGGGGGGTIIIPEPPVPLDPQPEPEVEIPEEDVPLVEIPEEEVPLVDVPKTGDASALWLMMSVLSGTGLAGVTFLGRKKKEEE